MHIIVFTNKKRGGYTYFHVECPPSIPLSESDFMEDKIDFKGNVFDIKMILDWKDIVFKTTMVFPLPPSSMGDLLGQVSSEDRAVLFSIYQHKWIRVWMNTFYTTHAPTSF
jgi:hypothetical protein